MKKIALISAIALSGLIYNTANAQLHIGFGIHINTPAVRVVAEAPLYPEYTPADDYYYLPDVDAYYSVPEKCYYYNNGDNWVTSAYLPGEYHDYDWRSARHYEVRANRPYLNADVYRARYRGNAYNWGRYNNDRRYYARNERRDNNFRIDRRDDHHGIAHSDDRFQRNFDRREQNWSAPQGRNDNRQQNWGDRNQGRNDDRQQNRDNGNQGRNDDRQQNRDNGNQGRNDNRQNGNDNRRDNNSNEHFADYRGQSGHSRFRS